MGSVTNGSPRDGPRDAQPERDPPRLRILGENHVAGDIALGRIGSSSQGYAQRAGRVTVEGTVSETPSAAPNCSAATVHVPAPLLRR